MDDRPSPACQNPARLMLPERFSATELAAALDGPITPLFLELFPVVTLEAVDAEDQPTLPATCPAHGDDSDACHFHRKGVRVPSLPIIRMEGPQFVATVLYHCITHGRHVMSGKPSHRRHLATGSRWSLDLVHVGDQGYAFSLDAVEYVFSRYKLDKYNVHMVQRDLLSLWCVYGSRQYAKRLKAASRGFDATEPEPSASETDIAAALAWCIPSRFDIACSSH